MARRLSPLALALVFALGGCGNDTPEERFERADQLWSENNETGALIELKNVVQAAPDLAEGRLRLGLGYLRARQPADAIKELEIAQELGADITRTRFAIAEARNLQGDFRQVLNTLPTDSRRPPTEQARIQQLRADALAGLGQGRTACGLYDQAVQNDPKLATALVGKARCAQAFGRFDEARSLAGKAAQLDDDAPEAWVLIGDIETTRRNQDAALAAYSKAVQRSPINLAALSGRARTLVGMKRFDDARKVVTRVNTYHPKRHTGPFLEGLIALGENQPAKARDAFQRALQRAPEHPESLFLMANAQLALGEREAGRTLLTRLLDIAPGAAPARTLLASLLLEEGDANGALKLLAPALESGNPHTNHLGLASEALKRLGRDDEARAMLERAVAQSPDSGQAALALSLNKLREGKVDEALQLANRALDDPDAGPRAALTSARILVARKDFDAAIKLLDKALAADANNAQARLLRGTLHASQKRYPQARSDFDAAQKADPGNPGIKLALIELDRVEGKTAQASERLRAALATAPNNEALLLTAATDALRSKREADADAFIARALTVAPDSIQARQMQIRRTLAKGDKAAAIAIARALKARQPENTAAAIVLIDTLAATGKRAETVPMLRTLVAQHPDNPPLKFKLAQTLFIERDTKSARPLLQQLLASDPGNRNVLLTLAALELGTGNTTAVSALADTAQTHHPASNLAQQLRGELALRNKNPALALTHLSAAFAKQPTPELALRVAGLQAGQGQNRQADATLADAVKRWPTHVEARRVYADRLITLGRAQESLKHYEYLYKQRPDSVVVLNNLASLLLDTALPRASTLAAKAYTLAPTSGSVADTYAQALYKQGKIKQSVPLFKQARMEHTDNGSVRYRYALALAKSGDTATARTELASLLKLKSPFSERADALALLQTL